MKKTVLGISILALLCAGVAAHAFSDHFNAGGMWVNGANHGSWDSPYTNYSFTVVDQAGDVWYGKNGWQGANTLGNRGAITPSDYTNQIFTFSGTIDSMNLANWNANGEGSWFTMGFMAKSGFDYAEPYYNSFMNNKAGVYLGFGRDQSGGYYAFLKNGGNDDSGVVETSTFNPVGAHFVAEFNTQTGKSGLSINGSPMQYGVLDVSMLDNAVGIAQLYHSSYSPYSSTNQSSIYLSKMEVGAKSAVPEPMSVVLGLMGLSSVAGFRKLRRK